MVKDFVNGKDLIATQPGCRAMLCKPMHANITKTEFSNSSSSSSLTDLTYNANNNTNETTNNVNQTSFSVKSNSFTANFEEFVCFTNEITSVETQLQRANLPTYLVTNVKYNKSTQYAYMITMNGDVFFFKMNLDNYPAKIPIWYRSINVIVLKWHKTDINVI